MTTDGSLPPTTPAPASTSTGTPTPAAPAAPATATPSTAPQPSPGHRLFVGLRVSLATANQLARAIEMMSRRTREAGADLRWVPPASLHLTLKFLGWTRHTALDAVRDALERATEGAPRLTFRTARIGAFPSLDKAAVVYAAVEDGAGALAALAARIETAMVELGYPAEPRPFHPHITLARIREPRETRVVKDLVLPVAEQMFGDTRVDAVTLFESETKSSGSVYKEISRIDFKQAPTSPPGAAERQTRAVDLVAQHGPSEREPDDTDDGWPRGQGPTF